MSELLKMFCQANDALYQSSLHSGKVVKKVPPTLQFFPNGSAGVAPNWSVARYLKLCRLLLPLLILHAIPLLAFGLNQTLRRTGRTS